LGYSCQTKLGDRPSCSCDSSTRGGARYRVLAQSPYLGEPFWLQSKVAVRSIHCESLGAERKCGDTHKRWPLLLQVGPSTTPFPAAMLVCTPDDPMSIFTDGNLQPGIYKVQNLASQTYLEIQEHSRGLCCRPATVLSPQDALVISSYC